MNSTPCSDGQFRADGFDYVVVIRVYEADDGRFSVQVKPVFRRNLGPNPRIEARADWMLGTNSTVEDAKRESQAFVGHNIRHVFGKSYRGQVKWWDVAEHLQRLPSW